MGQIQYIADENNNITGVIVPIELWREIQSEKETAYLFKSDAMKKRLLDAKDRKKALRLIKLIKEVQRDPFTGTGKPEPLKHELSGCWSRRIDQEHRLVYQVKEGRIRILACRYHY